jgi:secretion/DNA translocation related TadE-like protein
LRSREPRLTRSAKERGAGSVLGIGIMGAILLLVMACAPLAEILLSQSAVAAAADAAALAAADARVGIVGGFPCEVAAKVAIANRVQLASCSLDGLDATVRVSRLVLGFEVAARATAGPSRSQLD